MQPPRFLAIEFRRRSAVASRLDHFRIRDPWTEVRGYCQWVAPRQNSFSTLNLAKALGPYLYIKHFLKVRIAICLMCKYDPKVWIPRDTKVWTPRHRPRFSHNFEDENEDENEDEVAGECHYGFRNR